MLKQAHVCLYQGVEGAAESLMEAPWLPFNYLPNQIAGPLSEVPIEACQKSKDPGPTLGSGPIAGW